jgi:putative spermidine/putrescine transport system permease protein
MVRERSAAARLARAAVGAVVALGFAFMLVPIVLVVWLSFFDNQILALPPTGYTLRWYGALLGQPQFVGGFLTSLEVAIVATGAGLVVSVPAALALVRSRFRGREAMLQFLMSPLVVPAIVIGAGLYMFFIEVEIASGIPLVGSVVGLAVAHVLLTIPWCVRLVTANLVGVDPAVEEAAQSLGATPLATLVKVTLPMIWPGIVAAALFSFVISFGNLEISLFLVSPGETTLPIAILQYLMWKIDPTIASVSVLQIVVIGAGLLLTDRFVSLTRVV